VGKQFVGGKAAKEGKLFL